MYIATADLGFGLLWIGIGIAVLAVLAGVVAYVVRRNKPRGVLVAAYRIAYGLFALGAFGGAVGVIVMAVSSTIEVPVSMGAGWDGASLQLPSSVTLTATSSLLSVEDPSIVSRIVIGIAALLAVATWTTPVYLVARLCHEALEGEPFRFHIARAFGIGAVIMLVAGMLGELLRSIGAGLALTDALGQTTGGSDLPSFGLTLPLWPIGAALALGVLAVVFRQGERLQDDTTGLV